MLIVFDLNETLLDLQALDPIFARHLGDPALRRMWFSELLRTTLLVNLIGDYIPFDALADHALDTVGKIYACPVNAAARAAIRAAIRNLPVHADVRPALELLQTAGFMLACLTNSSPDTARAQLTQAGIAGYLRGVFSVDAVKRYKPAAEPYRMVAEHFGIAPTGLRMVAAHDWDVAGALRAGCRAALIARPGLPQTAVFPAPDIVADDLASAARQIISVDRP